MAADDSSKGEVIPELREFLAREDNAVCADCGAASPTWASVNLGVVVCLQCSGVHRNMGVHISMMQSVILDKWAPELLETFKQLGNAHGNSVWEHTIPAGYEKIGPDATREERDDYIRNKYDKKLFVEDADTPPRSAEERAAALESYATNQTADNTAAMVEFIGTVMILLKNGTNLVAKDVGGKSDPYVIATLGPQTVKSRVIKKTLNPEWNEPLILCVQRLGEPVKFEVYDWDRASSDDFMGDCEVDVVEEMGGEGFELTLPLQNTKRGSITIHITYSSLEH